LKCTRSEIEVERTQAVTPSNLKCARFETEVERKHKCENGRKNSLGDRQNKSAAEDCELARNL
jgi:hypothetical protein